MRLLRVMKREEKTGDICIFPAPAQNPPSFGFLCFIAITTLVMANALSLAVCLELLFKCWFSETTVPSQIIKLKALSQNIKMETACKIPKSWFLDLHTPSFFVYYFFCWICCADREKFSHKILLNSPSLPFLLLPMNIWISWAFILIEILFIIFTHTLT